MAQHQQQAKATTKRNEAEVDERPADQRDPELDEEVECCLSDIDKALDEQRADEDVAEAYERAIKAEAKCKYDELFAALADNRITEQDFWYQRQEWQAKYIHLFAISCCGTPIFDE